MGTAMSVPPGASTRFTSLSMASLSETNDTTLLTQTASNTPSGKSSPRASPSWNPTRSPTECRLAYAVASRTESGLMSTPVTEDPAALGEPRLNGHLLHGADAAGRAVPLAYEAHERGVIHLGG